jgi:hypothetical protein
MVLAPFDMFAAEVWIPDIVFDIGYAYVYLAAIALAEAGQSSPAGTPTWRYAIAALAAAMITTLMAAYLRAHWLVPVNMAGVRQFQQLVASDSLRIYLNAASHIVGQVAFGTLGILVYVWLSRSRKATQALRDAETSRAEAQRRMLAAQLDSAHEQIDPAAVLDRLALIEQTYETDGAAADAMMDDLIAYLRAAIPKLRSVGGVPLETQGSPG